MGLLDGLFNLNPEQNQGLLAAAGKMLELSGPSRVPRGLGQILGAAYGTYNDTTKEMQERADVKRQRELQEQLLGWKIKDAEADFGHQQGSRERDGRVAKRMAGLMGTGGLPQSLGVGGFDSAGVPGAMPGQQQLPMSSVGQQSMSVPMLGSPEWMQGLGQQAGYTPANGGASSDASAHGGQGAPSQGVDWFNLGLPPVTAMRMQQGQRRNRTQDMVGNLMSKAQIQFEEGDSAGAESTLELIQKFRPNAVWKEVRQPDGKVVNMPFFDDGEAGEASAAEVAAKLQWQDLGPDTVGLDAFDGSIKARHRNGVAPNTVATIGAQRERTEFERQQGRRPVYDAERGVMVDTRTGIASPVRTADGADFGTKEARQRTADSESVIDLLDSAGDLVKKATSSYGGMAVDQSARFFGGATNGAQAAAQLKAIEGMLISKMPKMSGPQSDKDVLLYRQMAGQIGDPTLPVRTKEAAMATIRAINNRHLGLPEDARRDGKGADGKFSVIAPNGKTYTFNNAKDLANFKLTAGIQ